MRGLADRLRSWLLPAGFLLGLSSFVFPLQNPDLWWHLSAGRWMAAHRALLRVDFLSHTLAGTKWVDFEWGTQLIYYAVHARFAVLGLLALKLALLGATVWTSLRLLTLYGMGAAARGLAALLLCAAILPVSDVRPDNFSLLFFNLLLLRLEARRLGVAPFTGRTWAGAVLFFALWANLHLAFLYGLLLIGLYAAAEAVQALLPLVYGKGKAGPWRGLGEHGAFGVAAAAGTLLNPYAGDLYGVLREHHGALPLLQDTINEWQLPELSSPLMGPYWLLLLLSFAAVLAHFLKTKKTPLPLVLALLYFGLSSSLHQRHLTFFCLSALPVFFWTASELLGPRTSRWALAAAWGLAGLLVLHVTIVRRTWMGAGYALSHEPARAAADFLLKEAPALGGLKLYNIWGDGGYLGYALYPVYRVFYDGRYIFHKQLFETSAALRSAQSWRAHMDRYGIEVACMKQARTRRQEAVKGKGGKTSVLSRPYYTGYMPEGDWALVYWNEVDLIFVRRSAAPKDWLARSEYRHFKAGDAERVAYEVREKMLPLAVLRAEMGRHQRQVSVSLEREAALKWIEPLESVPAPPAPPKRAGPGAGV